MIELKKGKIDQDSQKLEHSNYHNNKRISKRGLYQTNFQNYNDNYKYGIEKIDPKGIAANGVYLSISGVIQTLQLFQNKEEDLQLNYQIRLGQQWHDQTPETSDTKGSSIFCQAKNGKITFSAGFDTLISCMYIQSWPQLLLTLKGFDADGDIITRGYAQIFLPTQSGTQIKQAIVYEIVRNVKWYHNWLPFLEPTYISYDAKQFQRIIAKGEGRESQKIRCVGKLRIRTEVLMRNFSRFGYK